MLYNPESPKSDFNACPHCSKTCCSKSVRYTVSDKLSGILPQSHHAVCPQTLSLLPGMLCRYMFTTGLCTTVVLLLFFFFQKRTGDFCAGFPLQMIRQRPGVCNSLPVVLLLLAILSEKSENSFVIACTYRHCLAALHYNENSSKNLIRWGDDSPVLDAYFTKAKQKTGKYCVRRRKEKSTFGNKFPGDPVPCSYNHIILHKEQSQACYCIDDTINISFGTCRKEYCIPSSFCYQYVTTILTSCCRLCDSTPGYIDECISWGTGWIQG